MGGSHMRVQLWGVPGNTWAHLNRGVEGDILLCDVEVPLEHQHRKNDWISREVLALSRELSLPFCNAAMLYGRPVWEIAV